MIGPQTCTLCGRELRSEEGYCAYHQKAYLALRTGFDRWREAYGHLTYTEYLERLLRRPETGGWVRDVAEREIRNSRLGEG